MRIQSFLNVSNKDDIHSDSGFVFQRLVATELLRRGHQFCFASPVPLGIEGAEHELCDFGDNKFQVRFKFDWDRIRRIIEEYDPEILWINQAELAANFRAILCTIGSKAKLITYIHYIPIKQVGNESVLVDDSLNNSNLGTPILLSVLGSLPVSDKVLVQSQFAQQILEETLYQFHIPYNPAKIFRVPPPYDPFLLSREEANGKMEKSIMYNHRLYKHYGTDYFLRIIKSMECRADVQFQVADLLNSRNGTRQKLDRNVDKYRSILREQPNVSFAKNRTRSDYKEALNNCRIGLAAYRRMAVWSMSAVDCLGMGIPVIAPNFASYPEFIPTSLLYDSFEELKEIINSLLESDSNWSKASAEGRDGIRSFSPALVADKFLNAVND